MIINNEGCWEYRTIDDEFICFVIRYEKNGKKSFTPYTLQDGELKPGGMAGAQKPIYNLQSINQYPNKPILIVEGEKTADAGIKLFPEFNVITWMGGAQAIKKADFSYLKDKDVYLLPDNDEPGYGAMEWAYNHIKKLANKTIFVNIHALGVSPGWDIADMLDDNQTEVEPEMVLELIKTSKEKEDTFDATSYPFMGGTDKNPRPLDVVENLSHLLDFYKIKVRWNLMNRRREGIVINQQFYNEEHDNHFLHYISDLAILNGLQINRIDKHLDSIAWKNTYHPVRDWILSKPSHDKDIIDKFVLNVKTTKDSLSHLLIKRWMISAINSLFNENGFCAQSVLVIQGEQNTHKSSFIASLVPQELKAIKGGAFVDPSNKDSIITLSSYWIVELGELDATFRKADIARLKSHITNDIDTVRRPFAAKNSDMVRRTIYAATVNEAKFLIDNTGNRRWWTISLTEPINTRHGLDMQQVWRAAYDLWASGEPSTLTKDELVLLNLSNESFEYNDPIEEKLHNTFDLDGAKVKWMNCTAVLQEMGYDKPSRSDTTRLSYLLVKLKIDKGEGRLRNSYLMPLVKKHWEM